MANFKSNKYNTGKILKWMVILIGLLVFFRIYSYFDPYKFDFFPKCPFLQITGYKCPGCGSQRALHYLFNFEIKKAFFENMLLVVSIPYLILGAYLDTIKFKNEKQLKIRKALFGLKAIIVVSVIILLFWILRNLFYY